MYKDVDIKSDKSNDLFPLMCTVYEFIITLKNGEGFARGRRFVFLFVCIDFAGAFLSYRGGGCSFRAITFSSFHCRIIIIFFYSDPPTASWLLLHSFHLHGTPIFDVASHSSIYISIFILIPLFFSHSLFHQSDFHSFSSSQPPRYLFPSLGACPILPLSLTLSPHHCNTTPSPYLSSHPCFPSVWLEKLLWIIDW